MRTNKNQKQKAVTFIKQLKKKSKDQFYLKATWDAGNDSTFCNVHIVSEDEKSQQQLEWSYDDEVFNLVRNYLIDTIIDVLDLPNASEDHHEGSGNIFVKEDGDIYICYDDIYTNPYPENEEQKAQELDYDEKWTEITFDYDDPYQLKKYAHRVKFHLSAYSSSSVYINSQILEGDTPSDLEEAVMHLKTHFTNVIKPYFEKIEKIPTDTTKLNKPFYGISGASINADLNTEGKLEGELTYYYSFITYSKGRTILLA
ncbi:MAG: hypothetical protein EAZ55_12565 [Cytophagales bacterium]|nr:MAG: hypothetical protein EAZ55_12565 [Cytophagales bacterium]